MVTPWISLFLWCSSFLAFCKLSSDLAWFKSVKMRKWSYSVTSWRVVNFSIVLLYSWTNFWWSAIRVFHKSLSFIQFSVSLSCSFLSFSFSSLSVFASLESPFSFKSSGVSTILVSLVFSFWDFSISFLIFEI